MAYSEQMAQNEIADFEMDMMFLEADDLQEWREMMEEDFGDEVEEGHCDPDPLGGW
jgi:hypothetical protein